MCGFLTWFGCRPVERVLEAGLESIVHRGPDDSGVEADDFAWMGFRRLSILDLQPSGHQPMIFGGGRFVLTFNGEIYNFAELRKRYLGDVALRSTGDTAVLGSLLERFPIEKVLSELRGMFAFVWYDRKARRIVGARDHFGIKPLYLKETSDGIGIASEMRAIDVVDGFSAELNPAAIRDFFRWGAVQAPLTMLSGIRALMPGERFSWTAEEGLSLEKWFEPVWESPDGEQNCGSAWKEQTRSVVLDSVRAHLVSDVPVGIFLSGGLDSTLIACALRELGQTRMTAFSIGYEDGAGVEDESGVARKTADFLDTDFHRHIIGPGTLEETFDRFVVSLDQPTGDGFNTFLVAELACQHVKVALSGLGADEFFSGYTFHRVHRNFARSPLANRWLRRAGLPVVERVASFGPLLKHSSKARKLASFARIFREESLPEIHRNWRGIFTEAELNAMFGGSGRSAETLRALDEATMQRRGGRSMPHQMLVLETASYLPNTLLRDNDCVSMAHSLELRTPFVDREIFQLSASMPSACKLDSKRGKKILREAFDPLLPPWIKEEKRKKTFTLPLMKWLKSPAWEDRLRASFFDSDSVLHEIGAGHLLQGQLRHFLGSTSHDKSTWTATQRVWQAFVFNEWWRRREVRKANQVTS